MKTLPLKLDDKIFDEMEEVNTKLKMSRNRYINEAVSMYNLFYKRRLLKKQLIKESKLTSKDSMDILAEFENLLMKINQYDIWLADLSPTVVTEPGKTRPVVIIQTDLLNETHLSTIICPVTTNGKPDVKLLRVHLRKDQLPKLSNILVGKIRTIDNKRLLKKLGKLNKQQILTLKTNIKIVLDL